MSDRSAMSPQRSLLRHLVTLAVVFVIGLATMVFQLVWVRLALQQLGAGASTVAVMIATALLGLSIGATLIGRFADRIARPLQIVGVALLGGGLAMAITATADSTFASLAESVSPSTFDGTEFRQNFPQKLIFAICSILLINILLGTALPLLVRDGTAAARADATLSDTLGLIYGMETLGAASGCLLAGFWSIQTVGLEATLYLAATLTAWMGAMLLVSRWQPLPTGSGPEAESKQNSVASPAVAVVFLMVVMAMASASLGMEVIWQRCLVVIFGSDTRSYAIVAASYLIGVSAGASLSAFMRDLFRNRFRAYALTLIAMGTSATVVTAVLLHTASGQIPFPVGQLLISRPVVSRILLSMLLLLIPTIFIGMAFPMATTIWNDWFGKPAQSTARIYAVALVGNLMGVLSVGFYLIPASGLQIGMLALTSICIVGGLLLLFISFVQESFQLRLTPRSFVLFGSVGLLLTVWAVGSGRLYRQFWPIGVAVDDRSERLDFYAEGAVNTVAVVSQRHAPAARRMIVDGVTIGENRGGVDEKQQMLAHLPFLLGSGRQGQRVITIGLGTGILAGQLAQISQVGEVWAIELSPGVIAASEWFTADNGDILRDPKVRIIRADGIRFLRVSELLFDAIVSDAKSRPGYAGNIPFFSRDYYQLCRQRLADDGLFLQWVSLDSSPDSIAVILQTFAGIFPFGHIAIAAPDSIYLVGTIKPLQLSRRQIEQHLAMTSANSLRRYHWMSYDDFLSLYWLDQQKVRSAFRGQGNAEINTLDHPVLEAYAGADMAIGTGDNRGSNLKLLERLIQFDTADGLASSSLNAQPLRSLESVSLVADLTNGRRAAGEIIRAEQRQLELLDGWLDAAADHYTNAIRQLPALNRQRKLAALYRQLVMRAQTSGDINREFSALVMINRLKAGTAADQHRVAEILMGLGRPTDAVPYYYEATATQPDNADYLNDLAFCLMELGKNGQALARFRRVVTLSPEHVRGHFGLGITLARAGQMEAARPHLRRAGESSFELRQMIEDYGIPWNRILAGPASDE